jgi:hypothetical protein
MSDPVVDHLMEEHGGEGNLLTVWPRPADWHRVIHEHNAADHTHHGDDLCPLPRMPVQAG